MRLERRAWAIPPPLFVERCDDTRKKGGQKRAGVYFNNITHWICYELRNAAHLRANQVFCLPDPGILHVIPWAGNPQTIDVS